ncbi:MAG: hypothetical protein V4608_05115 [Bacteroidota bacterium]
MKTADSNNNLKRSFLHRIPVRLILSVIAGIAATAILSSITHLILYLFGIFPPLFKPIFDNRILTISLIYHSIFAIVGGYVTASLAKDKARKAIFILGSKEAIMWLIGTVLLWHHAPVWFNVTKAILGMPLAWMGGQVYLFYKTKHQPVSKSAILNNS